MSTEFSFPATRARSEERRAFLADVLTTAIEGGIQYWADVQEYHWSDPDLDHGNGTRDAYAEIAEHEEDEDRPSQGAYHIVTLDTIAHGWSLYDGESICGAEYGKQALLANRTNGEDGDYDADIADIVLQLGVFGKIIYG